MSWQRELLFVSCLVILNGCSGVVSENGYVRFMNAEENSSASAVGRQKISEYGAYLATLEDEERLQECERVAGQESLNKNSNVRLQYAFALMVTPKCGDLKQALEILRSYSSDTKGLSRQSQFQVAVVERILNEMHEKQNLKSDVEQMTQSEAVLRHQLAANELKLHTAISELRILQSKLDAIKSIEKSLNQRNASPIQ